MLWPQFIGSDATARSGNIDAEALINLYRQTTSSEVNAKSAALYGTPGLKLLLTVSDTGCRGMWAADGRVFAVIGATLYELNLTTNTATAYGTIVNDGKPVSMVSNGRGGEQLLIVGGGQVKVFSLTANTLSAAVALPGLVNAPVTAAFINSYFLLTEANSVRVWFSNQENGLVWGALDFFARSETSDNVVGLAVIKDRVLVIGSLTSELFYNAADPLLPFLPYPGTTMNQGTPSPYGIVVQDEHVSFVAQSATGPARVVEVQGSVPQAISTPTVGFALGGYASLASTEALVYEQEGHPFAIWTVPEGDATWAYDAAEQQWHQRLAWDAVTGGFHRWRARGCCTAGQQVLVGDYQNGNIYQLDLDIFADNGAILRRLRRAPYLSAENQWLFLDQVEIGLQSGVGLVSGQGSQPTIMLRTSGDSGHTWNPTTTSTGAMGQYNGVARWTRLGRFRADRLLLEISQTDPVRTVWGPGAWLRATPGTGLN